MYKKMNQQEVTIGKYTLESLTNGMYATPLDLYREYIQNAVDSIDEAICYRKESIEKYVIDVQVNVEEKKITISDNGLGISKDDAVKKLIDIGNSKKNRISSRGFRGIGRLAGLGYCEQLVFTTSYEGESCKTVVSFNAKELGLLLLDETSEYSSANSVLEKVITIKQMPEKSKMHFFTVELIDVSNADKLLDRERVKDYLIQHAPLRYHKDFKWKSFIKNKIKALGYSVPEYNIRLNGEELFKPYRDAFVSDRVKKNEDTIKDIEVIPLYNREKIAAIIWCAKTNYYGTIIENSVKGIRIRQGNILIGDKFSCSAYFKEERFNGWLVGEIYVIDSNLIANARRDDFEKNEAYYMLVDNIKEWSSNQSKEIRKVSYERSLSAEKKAVIEADEPDEVNDLFDESIELMDDFGESDFIDQAESDSMAEADFIGKLTALINQKKIQTKYMALNINTKLTYEQRKVLERVFDLIVAEYDEKTAESFINMISNRF